MFAQGLTGFDDLLGGFLFGVGHDLGGFSGGAGLGFFDHGLGATLGIGQAGGGFVARLAQLFFDTLVGHSQFGFGHLCSSQTFGDFLSAFVQGFGDGRPHEIHREPNQDRKNDGLRKQGCIDIHRNAFLSDNKSVDSIAAARMRRMVGWLKPPTTHPSHPNGAANPITA